MIANLPAVLSPSAQGPRPHLMSWALTALTLFLLAAPAQAQQPKETPPRVRSWLDLGKDLEVGYAYVRLEVLADSKGQERRRRDRLAIVGEDEVAWHVETNLGMPRGDFLFALLVDKKTGEVLRAHYGKPGSALREASILPGGSRPQPPAPTPPTRTGSYELPSGAKVPADYYFSRKSESETWIGKEGTRLAGVILRMSTPHRELELASDPKLESLELMNKDSRGRRLRVDVVCARYTSGRTRLEIRHPVARALRVQTQSRQVGPKGELIGEWRLLELRSDAKPSLAWDTLGED